MIVRALGVRACVQAGERETEKSRMKERKRILADQPINDDDDGNIHNRYDSMEYIYTTAYTDIE